MRIASASLRSSTLFLSRLWNTAPIQTLPTNATTTTNELTFSAAAVLQRGCLRRHSRRPELCARECLTDRHRILRRCAAAWHAMLPSRPLSAQLPRRRLNAVVVEERVEETLRQTSSSRVCVSVCAYLCAHSCLVVCLSVRLSLCVLLYVLLYVSLYVSPCVGCCVCHCVCLCMCLCVCLSVYVSLLSLLSLFVSFLLLCIPSHFVFALLLLLSLRSSFCLSFSLVPSAALSDPPTTSLTLPLFASFAPVPSFLLTSILFPAAENIIANKARHKRIEITKEHHRYTPPTPRVMTVSPRPSVNCDVMTASSDFIVSGVGSTYMRCGGV